MKDIKQLSRDIYKLKRVPLSEDGLKGFRQAAGYVRDAAKTGAHGGRFPTGRLSNSIGVKYDQTRREITAHIGTDEPYAPYVELGTGPNGQKNHQGIPPGLNPTYRPGPWWIPGDKIPADRAEVYGWPKSVDKKTGMVFYLSHGQAARPYLYPALKDHEREVMQILEKHYGEAIKKAMK